MGCSLSVDRKYESPSREITDAAAAHSHEILPGLVIGSLSQCASATRSGFRTICVRHLPCHVPACLHSSVLNLETWVASVAEMERVASLIREVWLDGGNKTYVHCFHGVERAPLAVAWFIHAHIAEIQALPNVRFKNQQMTFDDVYKFVRRMRPVALDRTLWLERVP